MKCSLRISDPPIGGVIIEDVSLISHQNEGIVPITSRIDVRIMEVNHGTRDWFEGWFVEP